jgi:hypothetical protein
MIGQLPPLPRRFRRPDDGLNVTANLPPARLVGPSKAPSPIAIWQHAPLQLPRAPSGTISVFYEGSDAISNEYSSLDVLKRMYQHQFGL